MSADIIKEDSTGTSPERKKTTTSVQQSDQLRLQPRRCLSLCTATMRPAEALTWTLVYSSHSSPWVPQVCQSCKGASCHVPRDIRHPSRSTFSMCKAERQGAGSKRGGGDPAAGFGRIEGGGKGGLQLLRWTMHHEAHENGCCKGFCSIA